MRYTKFTVSMNAFYLVKIWEVGNVIVYLDLIFLLNLLIDGATLHTTAWARKIQAKKWRIWVAATLGASYVLMIFVPALAFMFTFFIKCLLSLLMIYVAFGFSSLQFFLRNCAVFYFVNVVAAGAIVACHFVLQSTHDVMNGMMFTHSGGLSFPLRISGLFIIALFPLTLYFYRKVMDEKKRKELIANYCADTEVTIDGHRVKCIGLIDTGNQLYDPLTRTPVMIMEAHHWQGALPSTWFEKIQAGQFDELLQVISSEQWDWQHRLRLVPYKGINKGSQFMLALKPDKVVINFDNEHIETEHVLIGLSGDKLSSDRSYEAIIHPTLTNSARR